MTNPLSGKSKDIAVETVDLTKHYGEVTALSGVNIQIESGDYFVLLGPSGGGKTTLLRLIGGFVRPDRGRVLLHGRDASALAPNRRPTSMVFQSYALFPHMTVERNVGYGLRLRKLSRGEIRDRVGAMLDLVGLAGYQQRMPHELSGGQQQRVQLARSLVLESDILLLDEPLAALDAKLRKEMCFELKHIQEKVGITFVHVTHNQEEAMAVADRIALIAEGNLIEEGTPREIYERPRRRFTADFIGENNIFEGQVDGVDGESARVDLGFASIEVATDDGALAAGQKVAVSVRSELLRLLAPDGAVDGAFQTMRGRYVEAVYLGLVTSHLVALPDGREIIVRNAADDSSALAPPAPGEEVLLAWPTRMARLHVS